MTEVIRLDSVSKKFIIHREKHRSFQDVAVNLFRGNGSREEFWALENVSFSVRKGETVGIVGQNGSGKSTILKLITRIIEPTSGKILVNGTLSSLLELGAGFHPELTGRENIFLNGSLLGFSRREMKNKFDDIVEFSGLDQFIDVPVKHYSSGMYMRLAFAVAINVDPDILLIDEVLAVGDKEFQDKCLERIGEFQRLGKTIVFVSHFLETVKDICTRAIWLDHGKIRSMGESKRVLFDYLREVEVRQEAAERGGHEQDNREVPQGRHEETARPAIIQIREVKILGRDRLDKRVFRTGDELVVRLYYNVRDELALQDCTFSVSISDANGILIHKALHHRQKKQVAFDLHRGILEVRYANIPLLEGMYGISVAVWPSDSPDAPYDVHHQKHRFSVEGGQALGPVLEDGLISLRHAWLDSANHVNVQSECVVRAEDLLGASKLSSNGHSESAILSVPIHVYVGENDGACLQDGWFDAFGDIPRFRWTAGRASLFVTVPESSSSLFMKLCDPTNNCRAVSGRILVNGGFIGEFELQGSETRSLSFPLNVNCYGRVLVTIEVEPTIVPARVGLNPADTRELGLVVQEVWSE